MITLSSSFKLKFKNKIEDFCVKNNIEIQNLYNIGFDCQYNVIGNINDIDNFLNYIKKLEKENKNKNFWNKLWN